MGVRIQELPETTGINKEDVLIVEDGQGTKKGTVKQLDEALGVSQLKEDLADITEEVGIAKNVFDKEKATPGKFVNYTNGNIYNDDRWSLSDFIPLKNGKTYIANYLMNGWYAFYDSDKNFISDLSSASGLYSFGTATNLNGWQGSFVKPTNAEFVRVTFITSHTDDCMILELNSDDDILKCNTSDYIPYGKTKIAVKGINELKNRVSSIEIEVNTLSLKPLFGKKIIVIGDSMVYGNTVGTNNVWSKIMADNNGMQYEVNADGHSEIKENVIINAGVNGCMLSDNNAPFAENKDKSVFTRYQNMDNDADIVVVFAGTNDGWALARGEISIGDDDSTDVTTFNGALNIILRGLLSKYPSGKVAVITPYWNTDSGRQQAVMAIENACIRNGGIPCFQNRISGGIDWSNEAQKTALTQNDNAHLNEYGHKWVSNKYQKFLESI